MKSPHTQPYRIGVVGAGYWAKNMLRSIADSPECTLVAVADRDATQLDAIAQRYPGTKIETDASKVLTADDIDLIYIVTPPSTHTEFATAALESGKHVLVEKPMTMNVNDADNLYKLASDCGRVLMVGHTFVYSPPVLKVKELIDQGEIGEALYIDSQRVNLGKYQDSGVLWDLAPHDLSIVLYLFDELPITVEAVGRSFLGTGQDDAVFVTLRYASGLLAHLHLSWLAPARLRRTTIAGTEGMIVYDDMAGNEAVKVYHHSLQRESGPTGFGESLNHTLGDISIPNLDSKEPLRAELDHFIDCVRYARVPRSSGKAGTWTVAIMEAAEHSLDRGKRQVIEYPSAVNDIRQIANVVLPLEGDLHEPA